MENQTNLKKKAAHHAVRFIESGMIIGLGTGNIARFAVERLGELLRDGHLQDVAGIPSSLQTETLSSRAGIVEHGIFISLTTDLIIAERSGIRHLQRHNDQIIET